MKSIPIGDLSPEYIELIYKDLPHAARRMMSNILMFAKDVERSIVELCTRRQNVTLESVDVDVLGILLSVRRIVTITDDTSVSQLALTLELISSVAIVKGVRNDPKR